MNQKLNNNKNQNSSDSLVFGKWLQTKTVPFIVLLLYSRPQIDHEAAKSGNLGAIFQLVLPLII